MDEKILVYAEKNLTSTALDDGYNIKTNEGKLFLTFRSGRIVQLSEEEIKYQAIEFLKNEILRIKDI